MEERWFDEELSGCRLGDGRLDRRLRQLVERMEVGFGESIPLACQDWASTKAAYRFFSNDRVSEESTFFEAIFNATRRRFTASDGPILILHDTTEFTWKPQVFRSGGLHHEVSSGKDKSGRERMHTVCGLLMHSSLATTTDGLPLEWPRSSSGPGRSSKGTNALSRKINPTRVPIEGRRACAGWTTCAIHRLLGDPARCVHMCDREGDIWSCSAWPVSWTPISSSDALPTGSLRTGLIRSRQSWPRRRSAGCTGSLSVTTRASSVSTQVELSYRRMTIRPPIAKQKRYPALMLTVLHAREPEEPVGRPRIDWKLITRPAGRRTRCRRTEAAMLRHALED